MASENEGRDKRQIKKRRVVVGVGGGGAIVLGLLDSPLVCMSIYIIYI